MHGPCPICACANIPPRKEDWMNWVAIYVVVLVSSVQMINLPQEWLPPLKELCRAFEERSVPGPPVVIDVAQTLELTTVHVSHATIFYSGMQHQRSSVCSTHKLSTGKVVFDSPRDVMVASRAIH